MGNLKDFNPVLNNKILREYSRLYAEANQACINNKYYNYDKIDKIEEWIFNEYLLLVEIAKDRHNIELLSDAFINLYVLPVKYNHEISQYIYSADTAKNLDEKQDRICAFEQRYGIKYNFAKTLIETYEDDEYFFS